MIIIHVFPEEFCRKAATIVTSDGENNPQIGKISTLFSKFHQIVHSTINTLKQIINIILNKTYTITMLIHVTPISLIFSLILKFPDKNMKFSNSLNFPDLEFYLAFSLILQSCGNPDLYTMNFTYYCESEQKIKVRVGHLASL